MVGANMLHKTAFNHDGWLVLTPDPKPPTQRAQYAYDADGNLRTEDYGCDSGGVTSSADSLSSVVEAYVARQ